MPCTGRYATAVEFATMFCVGQPLTADETTYVEMMLDVAAADLHAAMAASDQCGCALATWATAYLAKLNSIEVAVIHNCRCVDPKLTDEQRQMWLNWLSDQMLAIRLGQIELCASETGSEYPSRATAEIGWTDWSEAQIIWNAQQRALP